MLTIERCWLVWACFTAIRDSVLKKPGNPMPSTSTNLALMRAQMIQDPVPRRTTFPPAPTDLFVRCRHPLLFAQSLPASKESFKKPEDWKGLQLLPFHHPKLSSVLKSWKVLSALPGVLSFHTLTHLSSQYQPCPAPVYKAHHSLFKDFSPEIIPPFLYFQLLLSTASFPPAFKYAPSVCDLEKKISISSLLS